MCKKKPRLRELLTSLTPTAGMFNRNSKSSSLPVWWSGRGQWVGEHDLLVAPLLRFLGQPGLRSHTGLNATFPGDAKEGMAEWIGCVDLPTYQWRGLSFTSWYFWARFLSHMRAQWPLYRVNIVHPELWEVLTQRVECFNGQQTLTLVPSVLYQHRPIWSATCMSLNTLFFMCVHLCSPKPFPSPTSWPYIIRGDVLTPFIVDNPQQTRKNNTQAFDWFVIADTTFWLLSDRLAGDNWS